MEGAGAVLGVGAAGVVTAMTATGGEDVRTGRLTWTGGGAGVVMTGCCVTGTPGGLGINTTGGPVTGLHNGMDIVDGWWR